MTYKISILTPVHISSGNKNACFLYHPDKNDHFNCYRIEDLLQFIPPQKLLELQPDNASNNGKKDIIKLFNNYVNYNQLKPQYFLFYKFKPFSKDVTEQVKSLNKPYIPGSSIKGRPILRSCSTTRRATAPGVWWAARRNCTSTTPATA